MKHSSFDASGGRLVVYFHGAPGGFGEAKILRTDATQQGLNVICQDRFSIASCRAENMDRLQRYRG